MADMLNENMKKNESKQDKFYRLINQRMPKLEKAMKQVSNLSDKRYYAYTESDVNEIKKTINQLVKDTFISYDKALGRKKEFRLGPK